MEPMFTAEQLNRMSRENLIELMQVMQKQQQKTETKLQLMEEKQKRAGVYKCDAFRTPDTCPETPVRGFQ